MIRSLSVRRGADEFAAAVDGGRPPRDEAAAELSAVVAALRGVEPVSPRPDFAADLRSRLMAEATAEAGAATIQQAENANLLLPARQHGRRERRLIAAATAFVLVGGSTTMAAAAQGALPGEALYPVKRGIERAESAISTSAAAKGRDLLEHASRRLHEVRGLLSSESVTARPQVPQTLADYSASASEGASLLFESFRETGDPDAMTAVRAFAAEGIATLETLADSVPAEGQDELAAAAVLLSGLDSQALALCGGCADELAPVEVPGILFAYAEVDRALAQASGHDLANSHPVVVPKEALEDIRRARRHAGADRHQTDHARGAHTATVPTNHPRPATDRKSDRTTPEDPPAVPGPGALPSLLPEVDETASGARSTRSTREAKTPVETVTKDLENGLTGVVETLVPDPTALP